jgi:L-aspartate oxidase
MEFIQFHPTTLYQPEQVNIPAFLISEAVRGEGAYLRNTMRYRFMPDYHPLAELAPRDVVTRAIISEMHKTNSSHVLLDFSKIKINIQERFPQIYRQCKLRKINITKDLVPVVPAAHYAIGGIRTDLQAQTSIRHLYACGETASSGVHGANRLASNSLLEGLVFGIRAAQHSKTNNQKFLKTIKLNYLPVNPLIGAGTRQIIKNIIWQNVGIIRDQQNLNIALQKLENIPEKELDYETKNLLTCAKLVTRMAILRRESRGCHYRADYPHKKFIIQHSLINNTNTLH